MLFVLMFFFKAGPFEMVKIPMMSPFPHSSISLKTISTKLNNIASSFLKNIQTFLSLDTMMGVYIHICSQPSQSQIFKIDSM